MVASRSGQRRNYPPVLLSLLVLTSLRPALAAGDGNGRTSFSGKVFVDATYLDQEADGERTDASGAGADLTRLYLQFDHRFGATWSAHLTTDVNWLRGTDSPTDLWIKHAYVSGAFGKALIVRIGAADLPWTGFVNNWSGYRYIDRELVTRLRYGASSDWGLHLLGAVGARGELQYAVSAVTGSSYKKPTTGDRADVEARLAWQPSAHAVVAIGGYDGTLANEDEPLHPTYHTARRWNAMAAYADDEIRVGAQYFRATDWTHVTTVQRDRASGWSAWASAKIAPDWAAFARYDRARTSEWLDPSRTERYANIGIEWNASEAVQVSLAYKRDRREDADGTAASSNEVGLWAQLSF